MSDRTENSSWWQMSDEDRFAAFEEIFLDEVESCCTANIACCDNCHDDFVAQWPYAYIADGARFQCDSFDLSWFHSATRLSEMYTEEEFARLIRTVMCPNCGNPLSGNIWPYELPFDPPDDYDVILKDLAQQASETPFLLVEYPFCRKVRDALADLATKCSATVTTDFLFRGRSLPPDFVASIADFDFCAAEDVRECRYNHAGDPVLYLGSSQEVCKAEMRDALNLRIAKFRFTAPLKILDLMSPNKDAGEHADILSFIVFSALLSARSRDKGFSRPEYVFSRFIKDCAKRLGFDAIRYPSTRVGTARFNLVIINRALTLAEYATDISILRADVSGELK